MSVATIKSIVGVEPNRPNEHPTQYAVGGKVNFWRPAPGVTSGPMESVEVTRIEFDVSNRGDHGIGLFHVYAGDVSIATLNERAVAEIHYDIPAQVPKPGEIPS